MFQHARNHTLSTSFWLVAVAACSHFAVCGAATSARADQPVDEASKSAPADDATIHRWVEDLGDPSYQVRGAAQAQLMRAGERALERIVDGARSTNPERRVRCVDILRRHAAEEESTLARLAQASLEELSKSDALSVARGAVAALEANARRRADDEAAERNGRVLVRAGGGMILVRPAILPRAVKRVAVERSVSITNINGKRTIVAKDGDRRVEITDGGDDGIKVTITDKVDGKEKKESYAAKDAKTLKEKHPRAYVEYARHAENAAARARLSEILKEARERPEKPALDKARLLPPPNHVDVPAVAPPR